MSDEFQEILSYLDTEDAYLKKLAKRIIDLCASKSGAEEAIKELMEKAAAYEADMRTCENVPFCNLLLSFAYFQWGDRPQAARYAEEAVNKFCRCGNQWNRALSFWGKAVVYRDNHVDQAVTEYKSAHKIFSTIANDADRRGVRERYGFSKGIMDRIKSKSKELEERSTTSNTPADTPKKNQGRPSEQKRARSYRWPTGKLAHLVYPIYDPIRAGKEGRFVFDTLPTKEAVIDSITFSGKPHVIYNIMDESSEIVLDPEVYRWTQVEGDSMNAATPIPIEEGDYVLVLDTNGRDIQAVPGNIVVVAMRDIGTPNESPGIIKRWSSDGLKLESESTNEYKPIPIKKADIRGVAIAIAKPA